jgi:hypothetical protein
VLAPIFLATLLVRSLMGARAVSPASIQFSRFASSAAFAAGTSSATLPVGDRLVLAAGEVSGSWISPEVRPQSSFTRLVASWNAETPADGRLRIDARATTADGETSDWYTLGLWAADDHAVPRTSVSGQADATVRRAYDRAQFERVWLRGSGATVYVIHPPEVPLPPPPPDAAANW